MVAQPCPHIVSLSVSVDSSPLETRGFMLKCIKLYLALDIVRNRVYIHQEFVYLNVFIRV